MGDVANLYEIELVQLLGPGSGHHLHALAHNRDPRPVVVGKRRGSMGAQHAIGRGPHSPAEIDLTLLTLVDRVTRRMRAAGRTGSTVTIRLRFGDFTRSTSSHTLARPTAHNTTVLEVARLLLPRRPAARPAEAIKEQGFTLIGVAVGSLDDNPAQLALPLDVIERTRTIDEAIDAVRDKFGSKSLRRAVQVGRSERDAMPILPD